MISTQIVLALLICYLPISSTILLKVYENARFEPFDNQSIISNLSGIHSRDLCICYCRWNTTCLTVMYSGYDRYCILYGAQLEDGQLRVMPILTNSTVISIRNKSQVTGKSRRIARIHFKFIYFDNIDPTTTSLQTTDVTSALMTTAVVSMFVHHH